MSSVSLLSASGEVLDRIALSGAAEVLLGRDTGPMWQRDPYLSPDHVQIAPLPSGRFRVTDQQSFNGTYQRIVSREKLDDGSMVRMGQQCLRFARLMPWAGTANKPWVLGGSVGNAWGRIESVIHPSQGGSAVLLNQPIIRLGRTTGEVRFPADDYMSGHHASILYQQGQVYVEDAGSRNGTFLRLREAKVLPAGSVLLVGQQLIRLEETAD